MSDFDLMVVGSETEGCLAAIAGARAGARVGILVQPGRLMGGLLTQGGLAFVDRDSRTVFDPDGFSKEGLYGEFLSRAGVQVVGLDPRRGHQTLADMLMQAGVQVVEGDVRQAKVKNRRVTALQLATGDWLMADYWLDATPDGDLAELAGVTFADGFSEYGIDRYLGVSPLPLIDGLSADDILGVSGELSHDRGLQAAKVAKFGDRGFLDPDRGPDYVLVGAPYVGLAYQRWRRSFPLPFQADGFNVALLGERVSSWNGLIYELADAQRLLALSRAEQDALFEAESEQFVDFLRRELGFGGARLLRSGLYVRQTRHALGTRRRLSLHDIARGYGQESVGTFCYHPDFRGFHVTPVPKPLVAHICLEAGLFERLENLAIASRAGGYTPFAHSLCRLVGYNVALGAGLAVASAVSDWQRPDMPAVRGTLKRIGALADERTGLDHNQLALSVWQDDPLIRREQA